MRNSGIQSETCSARHGGRMCFWSSFPSANPLLIYTVLIDAGDTPGSRMLNDSLLGLGVKLQLVELAAQQSGARLAYGRLKNVDESAAFA